MSAATRWCSATSTIRAARRCRSAAASTSTTTQLAIWARTPESGFPAAIKSRPEVTLAFYATNDGGPKMLLKIKGKAHVEPSINDEVYNGIIESEREHDPEKKGIAVLIDVESLSGFSPEIGPFSQGA